MSWLYYHSLQNHPSHHESRAWSHNSINILQLNIINEYYLWCTNFYCSWFDRCFYLILFTSVHRGKRAGGRALYDRVGTEKCLCKISYFHNIWRYQLIPEVLENHTWLCENIMNGEIGVRARAIWKYSILIPDLFYFVAYLSWHLQHK